MVARDKRRCAADALPLGAAERRRGVGSGGAAVTRWRGSPAARGRRGGGQNHSVRYTTGRCGRKHSVLPSFTASCGSQVRLASRWRAPCARALGAWQIRLPARLLAGRAIWWFAANRPGGGRLLCSGSGPPPAPRHGRWPRLGSQLLPAAERQRGGLQRHSGPAVDEPAARAVGCGTGRRARSRRFSGAGVARVGRGEALGCLTQQSTAFYAPDVVCRGSRCRFARAEMAEDGEVSALVCDNGSGMVKVRPALRPTPALRGPRGLQQLGAEPRRRRAPQRARAVGGRKRGS